MHTRRALQHHHCPNECPQVSLEYGYSDILDSLKARKGMQCLRFSRRRTDQSFKIAVIITVSVQWFLSIFRYIFSSWEKRFGIIYIRTEYRPCPRPMTISRRQDRRKHPPAFPSRNSAERNGSTQERAALPCSEPSPSAGGYHCTGN